MKKFEEWIDGRPAFETRTRVEELRSVLGLESSGQVGYLRAFLREAWNAGAGENTVPDTFPTPPYRIDPDQPVGSATTVAVMRRDDAGECPHGSGWIFVAEVEVEFSRLVLDAMIRGEESKKWRER